MTVLRSLCYNNAEVVYLEQSGDFMDKVLINSQAKVNLSLDVCGVREDGYHTVQMIMQKCNLCDSVYVEKCEAGISLSCNLYFLPTDEKNIAYKAAQLFFAETGIRGGVRIRIEKRIPVSAGLAGGSGNAAAVLQGLDMLYETKLSQAALERMGLKLGADVPYCLRGGTVLAEGIGEVLTDLPTLPRTAIVIVKPKISVSTADIYKAMDSAEIVARPDTPALIAALEAKDVRALAVQMHNVMEPVTRGMHPVIGEIKNALLEYGALGAIMSGSGPSVFGLFDDFALAKKAGNALKENYFTYVGWTN